MLQKKLSLFGSVQLPVVLFPNSMASLILICLQELTQFLSQTVTFFGNLEINPTFGTKYFSLSKSNFVGNRDLFLGIAFLALGGGCVILLIVFLAKWIS